jgi:hypothetical protein
MANREASAKRIAARGSGSISTSAKRMAGNEAAYVNTVPTTESNGNIDDRENGVVVLVIADVCHKNIY